jgi:hypothetical protein
MSAPLKFCTEAEFAAAPDVVRARKQIARLQEVIDHGVGDTARAAKIIARLEVAIQHCREHDAYVAVCNVTCTSLRYTVNEWAAAVDGTCWEIDRMEREAAE